MARPVASVERIERVAQAAAEFGAAAKVVDGAVADALNVNDTDLRLLGILCAEGSLSAGALARASGLSPAATTTAIARLVAAGHATRADDPDDRRRAVVTVVGATADVIESVYGSLAHAGHELLRTYTDRELDLIEGFLRHGCRLQFEAATRRTGGERSVGDPVELVVVSGAAAMHYPCPA